MSSSCGATVVIAIALCTYVGHCGAGQLCGFGTGVLTVMLEQSVAQLYISTAPFCCDVMDY